MPPNQERIIGIYVSSETYFGELKFEEREIPIATLAEMTRSKLVPILSIEEAERRNRNFMLVSDFAAKFDYNR